MSSFPSLAYKILANRALRVVVIAVLCAALPPYTLVGIVENTASTVFEAVPFLLGAECAAKSLRVPRLAAWGELFFGCGCSELPGALSLPASFFCVLTFGPGAAFLRWLASAIVLLRMRSPRREARSACEQLPSVALLAFGGALFSALLRSAWVGPSIPAPLLFFAGALAGLLAPCTLGALALAAGMRASAFPFAAGILCIAGIAQPFGHRLTRSSSCDGRFLYACIALACATVAARGGAGLLHPKLVPLMILGACLACIRVLDLSSACRAPYAMVPVVFVLLSGPMLHAPAPPYDTRAALPEHLFIGEELEFSGMLARSGGSSVVFRSVITCCRADAAPVALRLERLIPEPDGSWVDARGTVVHERRGLALRVRSYRRIKQPSDPFLYR